jgi:hypothetical protein
MRKSPPNGTSTRARRRARPSNPRGEWRIRSTSSIDRSAETRSPSRGGSRSSRDPEATRRPNAPSRRRSSTVSPRPGSRRKRNPSAATIGSFFGSWNVPRRATSVPPYRSGPREFTSRAKSSRVALTSICRPSSSRTPSCTRSDPMRSLMPPWRVGPERPGGRFHRPSASCTSRMRGRSARIFPSRSSPPERERPPPIEISSAARSGRSGGIPSRGSFPTRTFTRETEGGRRRISTVSKSTGTPRAWERRACETP